MKALILNSGRGSRMGDLTQTHPKCMTELGSVDTILSRQLKALKSFGVSEIIMTTGYAADVLTQYISELAPDISIRFVHNPRFNDTNYIYSIFLAHQELGKDLEDDLFLLHGDLVFDFSIPALLADMNTSCVAVCADAPLPEKDFKAVVNRGQVTEIGIHCFDNAVAAQPFYYLKAEDWKLWLDEIGRFVAAGDTGCYAENALNQISEQCILLPCDVGEKLCGEIDNPDDLERISHLL